MKALLTMWTYNFQKYWSWEAEKAARYINAKEDQRGLGLDILRPRVTIRDKCFTWAQSEVGSCS